MGKSWLVAVCLLGVWGCKGAPETSKYEAGDYVVYKYSGSYRPEPVFLTETILSKTGGNKLEILVEWKSGKEIRTWKQFVTDTAYNRANNIVDRLVRIDGGGKETELPNNENLDLFKLYEGTYLVPQRIPSLVGEAKRIWPVGKDSYLCRVRTYKTKALGRRAEMTVVDSAEFKWTTVGSSYKDLNGGLLYAVEVLECGNKK